MTPTQQLKSRLNNGPVLVCPGAANALAARLIEEAGFEACYVTGAGIANTYLGAPDIGLLTLNELAGHVAAIRDAVGIPLVVDADTGFGNPVGVQRAVRMLERAGADAIQIEDQVFPKRCGHFAGKQVVPVAEMEAKVRAAADARDTTLIIARTDARSVEGFDAAIERARMFAEAGADVTFVEAPESVGELLAVPERLPGIPQVVNLVEGGRTPLLPVAELGSFRLALFANAALQAAVLGMQRALATLRDTGSLAVASQHLAGWAERQRVVRKPQFDEVERRYAG
ncbi:carboxyvinyl-carboxyphosphonate phosphorylmutase [Micromonospora rhizosphaerae]|uniref:Carboxyvinyl-carboxyphosphonate phosphorylmutase n=1 Tax=Micromonospora rhizosphaerae TaxID=568872 RepID=A0A1C6SAD2_9ACTN|nr:isocitrate lyase/PEP mutase family protein [Micromonospora rhizosphaerae]SCL26457.1 carboxyvinyl-carboxyphosphonate phosphorylmutase [Micromonospora rhizosphaerae]